ncbi:hypothetical protein IE53DRAFT_137937 [Violaceomyces palustris]|uniref:Uncharacterized protein n=1 Tax=Violaceomyces palustris TaxID=1673888 RepID=A0ACD0NUP8_9BASI|nr:hypothetical protein IE53DRAFT_137937 [Violaceomyces palustris]
MMYYTLTISTILLVTALVLYWQRSLIIPLLPHAIRDRLPSFLLSAGPSSNLFGSGYSRVRNFDWNESIRSGLNSTLFDIEQNILDGDSRSGLEERGAMAIEEIMRRQGVTFDEARLIRHKQILANNNIDPLTGMPLDSKAVTSLS